MSNSKEKLCISHSYYSNCTGINGSLWPDFLVLCCNLTLLNHLYVFMTVCPAQEDQSDISNWFSVSLKETGTYPSVIEKSFAFHSTCSCIWNKAGALPGKKKHCSSYSSALNSDADGYPTCNLLNWMWFKIYLELS